MPLGKNCSYGAWKEDAKTNIRLLPKYGNAVKTKEQKEADERLIKEVLALDGTHRKASDSLIKHGFDYLSIGDLRTAMYRFNQAWLLDPQNENVFWGFGAIYFSFEDYQTAIEQYNEGLSLNSNSSVLLTDKGTVYRVRYDQNENEADLDSAINYFERSFQIDSTNQNTLYKASVAYYLKKNCDQAWIFYLKCKELGGAPIDKRFTSVLLEDCKR